MNRFLVLLFSLVQLVSFGQNKAGIKATITHQGQSYQVTANVPQGYYALTSTGQTAFNAAVKAGVWTLTTLDGCVIPAGTKPPKNKPTCSTTLPINYNQSFAAYQASGSGNTYDKSEASGGKIKDGELTYSVTSIPAPGSYTLVLSYQSNTAPPTALISVNSGSAQSLQLEASAGTLKTATATISGFVQGTNSVKITPNGYFAQDKITVSRVGSATTTIPDSPTVTTPDSPTSVAPGSGYYAYRADTYDYPSWPTGSTTNKFPTFENEFIKIQLALDNQKAYSTTAGGGGAIWKVFNKKAPNSNFTLLYNPNRYTGDENNTVDRSGLPNRIFWGQGLSLCLYKLPKPLVTGTADGANGPPHDGGLGLNPNECGDDLMNSGELLEYNVSPDGQGFHNKTRPPVYGQDRFYLPVEAMTFEKWVRLSGRAMKINYQANFNQVGAAQYADNVRIVTKNQEDPCLYFNGLRHFRWYDGASPYTNDNVTQITAPVRTDGKGNQRGGTNNGRPGGQFLSEPWIAAVGDDGFGIGLMLKNQYQAAYAYYGDGGFDGPNPSMGGSYGSITASPQEILDHFVKWRSEAEVIVGTVDEIRAYVYAHSFRPDFIPRFKWSRAGREGWSLNSGDGDDKHTWDDDFRGQAKDGWKVNFGPSYNAVIHSPAMILKAADTQQIFFKYAYSGNQTEWSMSFQRNAQRPDGAPDLSGGNVFASEDAVRYRNGEGNTDAQTVKFTVIPDGQPHVAVINLPSTWQGVINRVNIRPHTVNGQQYNAGESATLYWMNNKNEDPFPNN